MHIVSACYLLLHITPHIPDHASHQDPSDSTLHHGLHQVWDSRDTFGALSPPSIIIMMKFAEASFDQHFVKKCLECYLCDVLFVCSIFMTGMHVGSVH
jgi:hypothetical protein